ncbi:hypothetical protein COSO111634_27700 [Corallococcus soli]
MRDSVVRTRWTSRDTEVPSAPSTHTPIATRAQALSARGVTATVSPSTADRRASRRPTRWVPLLTPRNSRKKETAAPGTRETTSTVEPSAMRDTQG